MPVMRMVAEAVTDVGRERETNEDNFLTEPAEGLFVVCDGMGGHSSGEIASAMAVEEVKKFVCETRHQIGVPVSSGESLTAEEVAISEAIKTANEKIFYRSCREKECEGMGTTLVAALDADDNIVLAHVGDSRIYRLRDGVFVQLTEDHSLLNHLVRTKGLSAEEVANFDGKNVILRAVGLRDDVVVETQVHPKFPGDIFVLCSDGLTDMVDDETISEVVAARPTELAEACQILTDKANEAGGYDNITVMLMRVEIEMPAPAPARPLPPIQN